MTIFFVVILMTWLISMIWNQVNLLNLLTEPHHWFWLLLLSGSPISSACPLPPKQSYMSDQQQKAHRINYTKTFMRFLNPLPVHVLDNKSINLYGKQRAFPGLSSYSTNKQVSEIFRFPHVDTHGGTWVIATRDNPGSHSGGDALSSAVLTQYVWSEFNFAVNLGQRRLLEVIAKAQEQLSVVLTVCLVWCVTGK